MGWTRNFQADWCYYCYHSPYILGVSSDVLEACGYCTALSKHGVPVTEKITSHHRPNHREKKVKKKVCFVATRRSFDTIFFNDE